jgi:hypothetical protein
MGRARILIVAGIFGAISVTAAFLLIREGRVIDAKLLRVQGFPEPSAEPGPSTPFPCYILRLTEPDAPYLEFGSEQEVQFRIAGKWLAPEQLTGAFARGLPGCGQVGVVPNRRGAEAFRLHLTYRRQSLRNDIEGRIVGSSWGPKVPGWVLELVARLPHDGKWRHAVVEIELPNEPWWAAPGYEPHEQPHNPHAAMDALLPPLFAIAALP